MEDVHSIDTSLACTRLLFVNSHFWPHGCPLVPFSRTVRQDPRSAQRPNSGQSSDRPACVYAGEHVIFLLDTLGPGGG